MSGQISNVFMYFSYGSNLLAQRIHINNSSAIRAGIAQLKDYQLDFASYSKGWGGAPATIVPKNGSTVWGALWKIDVKHMDNLDRQEGVHINKYRPLTVNVVDSQGKTVNCRTYQLTVPIADLARIEDLPDERKPSFIYMDTVIKGALESGLPEEYIELLKRIPCNDYKVDNVNMNEIDWENHVDHDKLTEEIQW